MGNECQDLISEEEGRFLVRLARSVIAGCLGLNGGEPARPPGGDSSRLQQRRGVFVTLKEAAGRLRGCIGSLSACLPLLEGVRENALNAAFHDPRFPPLTAAELDSIRVEVSVLSPLRPLDYGDAAELAARLCPGRDGVFIEQSGCSATFLPQVWEQLPDPAIFLSHLCHKAGLPADEWRRGGLGVKIYQVQAFAEER